ncbi:hypothetical protein [Neobacillus dielmonensis]|nr:hypothetical protein [Neobacillus dielmonensis]
MVGIIMSACVIIGGSIGSLFGCGETGYQIGVGLGLLSMGYLLEIRESSL